MAINRKQVIDNFAKIEVIGNEEGLIPGFGVFINQLPATFWNSFAMRLTHKVAPDLMEAAEYLLVDAGQDCGYNTLHGVITSEEWKAIVGKTVTDDPEDVLHGIYAVLAAFGWARAEIVALTPGERMVVRAYDYYEADSVELGAAPRPCAYMLRGVSAAFMDLAYGAPFPTGLRTFECVQLSGIECGDDYAELVVTKRTQR